MALFEGKTPTERNKIIAAGVLGFVALIALYLAFGRGLTGGSTTTVKVTSSPTPRTTTSSTKTDTSLPSNDEQNFVYQTTAVDYRPGSSYAPDPGRNIFAFYEPPPPTPYVPTPVPVVTPKPATPTPTPPIMLAAVNPQSVYAGSKGFR